MNTQNEVTLTEKLLVSIKQGDRNALNELFETYRGYLRRVIDLKIDPILRGRVDASDIIQETQIVVNKRIEDYVERRPTSFKLWLRGEAVQQLGAQRRRHIGAACRSVQQECNLSDASGIMIARSLLQGTPSKIVERKELSEKMHEVMTSLPEKDREILLLRYVEELTNSEAAEVLAIEPATARKRHGRALKKLFDLMIANGLTG